MVVTQYYYAIFHSRKIKHTYMFCTMLQGLIWKLDNYVYVQGWSNIDSHSVKKNNFDDIWDKSKLWNTLVSPPPYPFASFINLGWFFCIYMSGNSNDSTVSSRLFFFLFFLIYSPIIFGLMAKDTALLQFD